MAAIFCKKTRVVYFPAPKNGSTSLRHFFFELENGFQFRKFLINGKETDLFWLYRNQEIFKAIPVPSGYEKIIVVLDPIKSTFTWLVTDRNFKFREPPEINDFVGCLEEVMQQSPKAKFHLMPQSVFFGTDLSYFDKVFRIEDIAELNRYLSERSGLKINLPWQNKSSEREQVLSKKSLQKLGKIYDVDYNLLQKYYTGRKRN